MRAGCRIGQISSRSAEDLIKVDLLVKTRSEMSDRISTIAWGFGLPTTLYMPSLNKRQVGTYLSSSLSKKVWSKWCMKSMVYTRITKFILLKSLRLSVSWNELETPRWTSWRRSWVIQLTNQSLLSDSFSNSLNLATHVRGHFIKLSSGFLKLG